MSSKGEELGKRSNSISPGFFITRKLTREAVGQ